MRFLFGQLCSLCRPDDVKSKNAFLERNTIAYIDYKYIGYAFKNRRAVPQVLAW